MAFGAGLGGLLLAEILRLGLVPPFGNPIHRYMSSFVDEKDQGKMITSHLYLLIGCACSVWVSRIANSNNVLSPYSGIIILGIGDSMVFFFFLL